MELTDGIERYVDISTLRIGSYAILSRDDVTTRRHERAIPVALHGQRFESSGRRN